MGRMACALVLVFMGLGFAQRQSSMPAGTTPTPEAAQSSEELTTPEVQQFIHDGLSLEPALADTSVSVKTDDRAIVLMGSVGNEKQHAVALRIAQSFTRGRQIVDKIKVIGTTSE